MAAMARDTCGLCRFLHSATLLQEPNASHAHIGLHCSSSEAHQLLVAALATVIDAYMIWACLLLWQRLRAESTPSRICDFIKDELPFAIDQVCGRDYGASGSSLPMASDLRR